MMTDLTERPPTTDEADRALKDRHRKMWALGDYAAVASEVIPDLGPVLVEAAGLTASDRVLDVAAGSGNVALPAARTGARVTASDLTPELLERGRSQAEAEGLSLSWEVGDAEALPYPEGSFDAVLSCVGVMFAPHHQAAADELVRVCRPGGRIALLSWTPGGFVGQLFAAMKPYAPPPPPGASPAPLWGDPSHVLTLLGDRVEDVRTEVRTLAVTRFTTGEAFRDYFKTHYGPTVAVYASLAGQPERLAALDEALAALGRRFAVDGSGAMAWEYLLVTARRATTD